MPTLSSSSLHTRTRTSQPPSCSPTATAGSGADGGGAHPSPMAVARQPQPSPATAPAKAGGCAKAARCSQRRGRGEGGRKRTVGSAPAGDGNEDPRATVSKRSGSRLARACRSAACACIFMIAICKSVGLMDVIDPLLRLLWQASKQRHWKLLVYIERFQEQDGQPEMGKRRRAAAFKNCMLPAPAPPAHTGPRPRGSRPSSRMPPGAGAWRRSSAAALGRWTGWW